MLFNQQVLEKKLTYLDTILEREDLLEAVLREFSRGEPCQYEPVQRTWSPGGGSSLFSVRVGASRYFLKVKHQEVLVESRLEAEDSFSELPSLRNEFRFLERLNNIIVETPRAYRYLERDGYGFLFLEHLSTFDEVAARLSASEFLRAYRQIEATVRKLFELDIVHTDVHEKNIMFRGDVPILIDFEEARILAQHLPFEQSLDSIGENRWGNVGEIPTSDGTRGGLTCLSRLKEVFRGLMVSRLGALVRECRFDSSCPYLRSLDHGTDERIYQSIDLPGFRVEGQRPADDTRIDVVQRVTSELLPYPFTHLDIGSNLGVFNIELEKRQLVRDTIGIEAHPPYVELAEVLAFLAKCERVRFIRAECGEDSLRRALAGTEIDLVTVFSVFHHISNRNAFLEDLKEIHPRYVMFEMATQRECYEGRSWEEEIAKICEATGMMNSYFLGTSTDYERPIVLVSGEALPRNLGMRALSASGPNRDWGSKAVRVSIVLPTYNHLQFLPAQIESVLAQTFPDFELIIVNDGSTDGTSAYLDQLEDPRIRTIHQQNTGLPEALNTGMRESRGEFLTWISADNFCAPVFLEALVGALDAEPSAGFAYSAFAWIDESGAIQEISGGQEVNYRTLLAGNPGIASFMYRSTVAHEVGEYESTLEGAEDWDMWLRIVERFPAVHVPEILCYYRRHPDSMTGRMFPAIQRASRAVLHRAIERKQNELRLVDLYPALTRMADPNAAKAEACFDFGTLLLRSPYADPEIAAEFLEAALAFAPGSLAIISNLLLAQARASRWTRANELLDTLEGAADPQARDLCDRVRRALRQQAPTLLQSAPVYTLNQEGHELFTLESRLVFSLTAASGSNPACSSGPNTR